MTTDNSRADALTDLLPCPFCGSEAKHIQGFEPIDDAHFIDCATCGISSKIFDTKEAAFAAWNLRAASPANQPAAAPIVGEVAQWQCRLKDRSSPVVDGWMNIKPDGAKTLLEKYDQIYEVRALYERHQPAPSPAGERAATFEEWFSSLSPQRRALIGDVRDVRMGWEAARAGEKS